MFALAHPLSLFSVLVTEKNRKKVGELMQRLVVTFKEVYNDEEVERMVIKKVKFTLKVYSVLIFMMAFFIGVGGCMQVLRGHTFVTIVTVWPNIEDTSTLASISRAAIFLIWILFILRLVSVFIIVIPLTICISHQYTHLSSYFQKLNNMFLEKCSQEEKEINYEKGLKVGIKLHAETLNSVKQLEVLFNAVYGCNVLNKSTSLMALMASMAKAERSMSNLAMIIAEASYALISLGYLMWNAGDMTVEAAKLPSSIMHSGWHNCSRKSAVRIRPLVVFALQMSQKPVVLKCLGCFELSYESYVTIVKSCYSGFSVLY